MQILQHKQNILFFATIDNHTYIIEKILYTELCEEDISCVNLVCFYFSYVKNLQLLIVISAPLPMFLSFEV